MAERPKPPQRVRVTKLQEAHLLALVAIEERVAAQRAEAGAPAEQLTVRTEVQLARLPRSHDVYVAEADHEPTGFLAWKDEAPGVAVIDDLQVDPEMQRYGIATRLLRELGEQAARHGIEWVACPCWERDKPALAFLAKRGFLPAEVGRLPDKLAEWAAQSAAEHVAEGQQLWWSKTDGLGHIPGLPRPEPE